ncbi:hypothetical protein GGR51DRAFT_567416 [Nemania sp. FL0031]|nr:hypothetical protein GGR51DRAFT_567416 [Nemania sp. FL0031]
MPRRSSKEMFDLGASEAMANTEFSSGIFEAPQLSAGSDQNAGPTGGGRGGGSSGGGGGKASRKPEVKSNESISKRLKDTAGAGALIL